MKSGGNMTGNFNLSERPEAEVARIENVEGLPLQCVVKLERDDVAMVFRLRMVGIGKPGFGVPTVVSVVGPSRMRLAGVEVVLAYPVPLQGRDRMLIRQVAKLHSSSRIGCIEGREFDILLRVQTLFLNCSGAEVHGPAP